jgi:hypothetical protein
VKTKKKTTSAGSKQKERKQQSQHTSAAKEWPKPIQAGPNVASRCVALLLGEPSARRKSEKGKKMKKQTEKTWEGKHTRETNPK